MLQLGDEFFLGDENFSAAPTVGQFAAPVNGKTTMAPAATMPATGMALKIEDVRKLIMGQAFEGSKLYRCRVVRA